jgi:hypothetical protein
VRPLRQKGSLLAKASVIAGMVAGNLALEVACAHEHKRLPELCYTNGTKVICPKGKGEQTKTTTP